MSSPFPLNLPLLMEPVAVAKAWGNGPETPEGCIGETWEVSDVPGSESRAVSPAGRGMPFGELVRSHPAEVAGDTPFLPPDGRFPLLVKYLFAGGFTSIQVHPADDDARGFGEAHPGKSEAWVVVAGDPGALILRGFATPPPTGDLAGLFASGDVLDCLRRVAPVAGMCLPVPPGTIHAMGGGLTVFEVQTNSQVTYRLYDWGRDRREGLHLSKGIACLRTAPAPDPPPPDETAEPWGRRSVLHRGSDFVIERHRTVADAPIDGDGRFTVVSSLGPGGGIGFPGGSWEAAPRRTWLIPAACRDARLLAGGDYLVCFVPRPGR